MLEVSSLWRTLSSDLGPEKKLLTAVSGGADSVALLYLALPPEEMRSRMVVGHVHHGTGPFADESEKFVRELANHLHLPCEVRRIELTPLERKQLGFEAAAREKRYDALEEIARLHGCVRFLTGHTLDDQAESFLLAALRGAGTGGLAGVRAVRGYWQRPLLSIKRQPLRDFLTSLGVTWMEDPSNENEQFTRVKVRKQLYPLIEKHFGEGGWENLAHSADYLAEAQDVLESAAFDALKKITQGSTPRWISVDALAMHGYFPDTQDRILMSAWCHAAGVPETDAYFSRARRKHLQVALRSRPGDRYTIDGVILRRSDNRLIFDGISQMDPIRLDVPGVAALPDGATIEVELQTAETGRSLPSIPGQVEFLDAEQLGKTLTIRPWREGDRFDPLGRPERQVKVTRALRRKAGERIGVLWVLRTDGGDIAFVAGERIADPVRVRPETRTLAKVTFTPPAEAAGK